MPGDDVSRTVQGAIKWARPCPRPRNIPISRARGAKAFGLRYEKAFALRIRDSVAGQWFEYEDASGKHFCQMDLLFKRPLQTPERVKADPGVGCLVVAECKYSWTLDAFQQLHGLYLPVLRAYAGLGRQILGFQVCKRLLPNMPQGVTICRGLEEALSASSKGQKWVTLHWLGKASLETAFNQGVISNTPAIAPSSMGL